MNSHRARLTYVDNLRILLSSLVVLFHLALTYGAIGFWPYTEGQPGFLASYVFALFTTTCQSFFMGLFFLISAYFTHPAFERKGATHFALDRLLRLGVPLTLYALFVEPLTWWLSPAAPPGTPFLRFLLGGQASGVGALWFVAALLCFSAVYMAARALFPALRGQAASTRQIHLRDGQISAFIVALGLVSFLVRVAVPIGWALPILGFGVAHFPQYIALFSLGILAARHGVENPIPPRQAKRWLTVALTLILFVFPAMFALGGAAHGEREAFMGGAHWQSLAFALWEQATGIAIMVALLGLAKEKWNCAGRLGRELAACAYPMYVFHPPILVFLCAHLRPLALPPVAKFLVVWPFILSACFLIAALIRRLPYTKRIW